MRVLVANNHLVGPQGSETWTLTFAEELARRGHEVSVFSWQRGPFLERFKSFATVVGAEELMEGGAEVAFVSHKTCLELVPRDVPVFVTCHGVLPPMEQPVVGLHEYVSVSEEVQEHLRKRVIDSEVVWNAVNMERFRPTRPLPDKLERVTLLSNHDAAEAMVGAACEQLGLSFIRVGYPDPVDDVPAVLNVAELVVTVGRGVLEAMACGRNVVCFDRRGYMGPHSAEGFVTPEVMGEFMKCNCSGRVRRELWGIGDLVHAFKQYDPDLGRRNREWAITHVDIRDAMDRYYDIAKMS